MTRARDVANLIGSGNYSSTTFTATAGQTAFTISHTQGFVQVFMNGLLLDETVDYTSNGTAITLTSGAAAGDEIEVVAYNTFSVGDALPKSGGTISGNVSVSGGSLTLDNSGQSQSLVSVGGGSTNAALTLRGSTGSAYAWQISSNAHVASALEFTRSSAVGNTTFSSPKLILDNDGLKFNGDTAAVNALNDYEEGTWTPVIGGATSTSGQVYNQQNGTYTKIGNLVTAHAYVALTNVGTVTGTYAYIMGLPFPITNNSGAYPSFAIGYFGTLQQNVSSLTGYGNKGSSFAYITFRQGAGLSSQYLSPAGIGNSAMIFTMTYTTES